MSKSQAPCPQPPPHSTPQERISPETIKIRACMIATIKNSPSSGTVALQSKQMALDEINAAGGINGRMLELVVEDSKCSAQDAITAYTKLTNLDGIKIILGASCSGAMLGVAPLAEKDGVVLFSGLASSPDIANAL